MRSCLRRNRGQRQEQARSGQVRLDQWAGPHLCAVPTAMLWQSSPPMKAAALTYTGTRRCRESCPQFRADHTCEGDEST